MSVRQFLIFLSLSALAFAAAIPNRQLLGAGVWILVYVAVNLLLVAIAYGGSGPAIFRKRVSGTIPWLVRIILAPYLLLNELAFQLFRLTSSEPPVGKAADNLYFGRRLTAPEAKRFAGEYGWQAVLDLAPEFADAATLRKLPNYRSLPILDATAPTSATLAEAVSWISQQVSRHPVYVHCALGHGRTATVVVAYLVRTGQAASVDEALKILQSQRSQVDMHKVQKAAVEEYCSSPPAEPSVP